LEFRTVFRIRNGTLEGHFGNSELYTEFDRSTDDNRHNDIKSLFNLVQDVLLPQCKHYVFTLKASPPPPVPVRVYFAFLQSR